MTKAHSRPESHPRKGVRRFLGARLHRKIFLGFGAAIALMGLISFALGVVLRHHGGWKRDQLTGFVSERFERVWDDETERSELLDSVARTFQARLVLSDVGGQTLRAAGGHCDSVRHQVPIVRNSQTLGHLAYCGIRPPHPPAFGLLYLGIAGGVLWFASGFIARRISRPLRELTSVARRIGAGQLEARVRQPRRQADEVGELSLAVNEMAERIQKQMSDQRELLAAVSHEIRTPLGHLRVLLELLERDGIAVARREQLERELSAIDQLIGELLANSRLEFGALDAQPLRAADFAQSVLERAGASFELVVDATSNAQFVGDPTLLTRALANLIDNARKHGDRVKQVELSMLTQEARALVCFRVVDDGPGFTPEEATAAFRPFFRGSSGSSEQSSLGLGLALVQRIAQAHGGDAWVENVAGEGGAAVSFSVPTNLAASSSAALGERKPSAKG